MAVASLERIYVRGEVPGWCVWLRYSRDQEVLGPWIPCYMSSTLLFFSMEGEETKFERAAAQP